MKVNNHSCFICKHPMCEVCQVCEAPDCKAKGKMILNLSEAYKFGMADVRTQKLRGYLELAKKTHGDTGIQVPRPFHAVQSVEDLPSTESAYPTFARPCPKTPWHGFVESRIVKTRDEAAALFEEAQKYDSEAELLLCKPIEADYNLVVTPSSVTIGPGNDGATAGRDVITIPLVGSAFGGNWGDPETLLKSGVDITKEDPYFEVVTHGQYAYVTQLRAGVKAPRSQDYIPSRFTVQHVVPAEGDLIAFRDAAAAFPDGTVVNHHGGSLTSHYGVHCLINNLPVVTSFVPEVGQTLEKTGDELPAHDPYQVMKGIAAGTGMPLLSSNDLCDRLRHMLMVLHNSAALGERHSFHIGFAAVTMFHAGMAAAHGEARHHIPEMKYTGRHIVHLQSFKQYFLHRLKLGETQWSFMNEQWSSSYGGKAWAQCTNAIILLDREMRKLMHEPTEDAVKQLVNRLNFAVNQAHNGGWWLDKFISKADFDAASEQSVTAIIRGMMVVPKLMSWKKQNPEEIAAETEKWKQLYEIPIVSRPGNMTGKRLVPLEIRDGVVIDPSAETKEAEPATVPDDSDSESDAGDMENGCDCDMCKPHSPVKLAEDDDDSAEKPSKVGKYYKGTLQKVIKAHARWEGGTQIHIQYHDGKHYDSIDVYIPNEILTKVAQLWSGIPSSDLEQSYSSNAGGYKDCDIIYSGVTYLLCPEGDIGIALAVAPKYAKVFINKLPVEQPVLVATGNTTEDIPF
jgi:hypothetical protein